MIVHGLENLDEISISGTTMVGELKGAHVREYPITPDDFGLETHEASALRVDGPDQSKAMIAEALENRPGAARDIVAINAGASIYVAGVAASHQEGVQQALATLASGAARAKLDAFVAHTRQSGG